MTTVPVFRVEASHKRLRASHKFRTLAEDVILLYIGAIVSKQNAIYMSYSPYFLQN